MGTAMFYHLTRSVPDDVVAMILPRALSTGWRVMLRSPRQDTLDRLDARLWQDPADGFLPHGMETAPHAADQPVLLGNGPAVNHAQAVFLLDGAEPLPAETALERLWIIFDGGDDAAVQTARRQWSALTATGMAAQYWSEESGRWAMKTEKKALPPQAE
jgi:DNA polymerase III subunit chi